MSRGLRGARALVTRAIEDAPELETLLRARGAEPVSLPCLEFQDLSEGREHFVHFLETAPPDLVVVASPHAARLLRGLFPRGLRLAAAGAATAALLPEGALVPSHGVGAEALVAELAPGLRGKRVLIPRAEGGNPALAEGLVKAGALVETLTLYRTVSPESADPAVLARLRAGAIEAVSFASGSAARNFARLAGPQSAAQSAVACMGRLCAEEARAAGLRVDAVGEGGLDALCDALERALGSSASVPPA